MLALSRRPDESLVIGNDIEITVLEVKGDQVKLGIKAPKTVGIYRKELYDQIQQENKAASESIDNAVDAVKNLNDILKG
ncbi:MAG: carbon storage regulator CsrA [Catonella sp.]|jgi:carbon storage regulator|nr:carbon storage regulator CsrA [Catonella sp.]MDY6355922.1 carbon storage regulator CsrA [Catonella sp.]